MAVLVSTALARAATKPIQELDVLEAQDAEANPDEAQAADLPAAEPNLDAAKPPAEAAATDAKKAEAKIKCRLNFSLAGWSAFYKQAKGEGTVSCDDGQVVPVDIKANGGGVTFGKSSITDGHGTFSKVDDIHKLFGSYATSEAHAGIVGSAGAQAMTKGKVSLALSGTGRGYDLGFAFGRFKITPKGKE